VGGIALVVVIFSLTQTLRAGRDESPVEPAAAPPAPAHRASIAPTPPADEHLSRVAPVQEEHSQQEEISADDRPNPTIERLVEALARCRSSLTEEQRHEIAEAVDGTSRRHGYEPLFVQAMIEVESMCEPTARSRQGAVGLIQVQPATARALAEEAGIRWRGSLTLLDPAANVRLGILYLSQLEERFGDLHLAVAAYNLGPNRVENMSRDRARRTRYVRKVLARYRDLIAENSIVRVRATRAAAGRIG
jgi:hypothetical protein